MTVIRPALIVASLALSHGLCGQSMPLFGITSAHAQSTQRGLAFARANCARCHSVDKTGESPLPAAPPFRILHQRYPVETLEEALGEGIVTGHPSMPEFRLDPGQIADLIAFLKSLE